jgi:hypothetical protein
MEAHIAEVIDLHIDQLDISSSEPSIEGGALSAALILSMNGTIWEFGGRFLFASIPGQQTADLTSYFILRCMQVCKVTTSSAIQGELLKVRLENETIHSIASLDSEQYFYPPTEFEGLIRT